MIALFAAFRILPGLTQLAILGGVLVSILGAYYGFKAYHYNRGYNAAISDIATENKEAVDAANKLKANARNCAASGGFWDQSAGLCR